MTWRARALAAGWLAALALFLAAPPAAAHATLVSTDPVEGEVLPETPDVVTFTYDERVVLSDDSIQVFDAAGEPVDSTAKGENEVVTADLPDDLENGTYVVAWRVVSADGHPISGSLTFSIGAPSENVVAPDVGGDASAGTEADLGIAQALGYAGLLVAAGLAVFCAWMLGDARPPPETMTRLRRLQRPRPCWRSVPLRSASRSRAPTNWVSACRGSPTRRPTTWIWWATTSWCSRFRPWD